MCHKMGGKNRKEFTFSIHENSMLAWSELDCKINFTKSLEEGFICLVALIFSPFYLHKSSWKYSDFLDT